jgi:quinol monooxygenase YgiN
MYATILRGKVTQENWGALQHQYEKMCKAVPEGLLQTYLVQDHDHAVQWQIITLWKSEEAYLEARKSKKTEACENLFCDAGSVPERSCYHVKRSYHRI